MFRMKFQLPKLCQGETIKIKPRKFLYCIFRNLLAYTVPFVLRGKKEHGMRMVGWNNFKAQKVMTVGGGTSRLEAQLEKELYSPGCFSSFDPYWLKNFNLYKMLWVFCCVIGINFL